jgi:ankyrin repeat protein
MWCSNNLEKVRLLLDKGADVNARSKQGRTPLVIAAAHDGNIEVMRLLIKKGADVKAKSPDGFTALISAASHGNVEAVKLLLARGADVNAQSSPSGERPVKNGPIAIGSLKP